MITGPGPMTEVESQVTWECSCTTSIKTLYFYHSQWRPESI